MSEALNMSVSQVFNKDGKKYAFVSFTDGTRQAEGQIPDCKITARQGFDEAEAKLLEHYMKENLSQLKKMASSVRVMNAFMHD
ncbi:MAG: hypothetical protein HFJ04_02935 [Lachnospiraceae bacterium]|nr:hypothetical protein [Lachnospiraceae bacterium]